MDENGCSRIPEPCCKGAEASPGRASDWGEGGDRLDPTVEDELERRWLALEKEMQSARRWLTGRSDFVIKEHKGIRFWVLQFYATLRGTRRRCAIVIGTEEDVELLRRARRLLAEFRSDLVVLECAFRCQALARQARRHAEPPDES